MNFWAFIVSLMTFLNHFLPCLKYKLTQAVATLDEDDKFDDVDNIKLKDRKRIIHKMKKIKRKY